MDCGPASHLLHWLTTAFYQRPRPCRPRPRRESRRVWDGHCPLRGAHARGALPRHSHDPRAVGRRPWPASRAARLYAASPRESDPRMLGPQPQRAPEVVRLIRMTGWWAARIQADDTRPGAGEEGSGEQAVVNIGEEEAGTPTRPSSHMSKFLVVWPFTACSRAHPLLPPAPLLLSPCPWRRSFPSIVVSLEDLIASIGTSTATTPAPSPLAPPPLFATFPVLLSSDLGHPSAPATHGSSSGGAGSSHDQPDSTSPSGGSGSLGEAGGAGGRTAPTPPPVLVSTELRPALLQEPPTAAAAARHGALGAGQAVWGAAGRSSTFARSRALTRTRR